MSSNPPPPRGSKRDRSPHTTIDFSFRETCLRHGEGLDVPDLLGVLVDGAVGVELTGEGGGDDGGLRPASLVLVRLVNLRLALDVALEILRHEEVVAAAEALVALQGPQELVELAGSTEGASLFLSKGR